MQYMLQIKPKWNICKHIKGTLLNTSIPLNTILAHEVLKRVQCRSSGPNVFLKRHWKSVDLTLVSNESYVAIKKGIWVNRLTDRPSALSSTALERKCFQLKCVPWLLFWQDWKSNATFECYYYLLVPEANVHVIFAQSRTWYYLACSWAGFSLQVHWACLSQKIDSLH